MDRKSLIRLPIILGGLGIIFVSIFAFPLGLDNDPGMGPGRFRMLLLGLGLVLFGAARWLAPVCGRMKTSLIRSAVFQGLQAAFPPVRDPALADRPGASKTFQRLARSGSDIGLVLLGCFLVWVYAWVITAGTFEKLPAGRDYYWLLAQAFRQGQTHLLVAPNPELLKLENPYDHLQRKGLEYLWDTTLHDGKYYLYWGPVPALIGVLVSTATSRPVTDAGLVFGFVTGTALFSVLLLRDLYRNHGYPAWLFWGGVLSAALNVPLIWLLTRPKFYEVSISGGQFFLMAGFFLLLRAFRSSAVHKGYLTFSALGFGLACATRINLIPAVIFLACMISLRIYRAAQGRLHKALPALMSVLLPMALIACSLFWYNFERFGSIFEFGHRYQLTGPSLPADYQDIVSTQYIVPNVYTYLFRPPVWSSSFPFLTVPWIKEEMWPDFIRLPAHYYYTEPVAGLLFVVPLTGLTVLFLIRFLWLLINGDIPLPAFKAFGEMDPLPWFALSLLGYVLIQMLVLMFFINSAMRYLLDVSPALIVLALIFAGSCLKSLPLTRWTALLWVLASALTGLSGFLIGFTGDKNNFLNRNPQLYSQLSNWFNH